MIEDLTMLANLPVVVAEADSEAKLEADKAAASETMPPPKPTDDPLDADTDASRLDRRGQDPPQETGEEDS